MVEIFLVSGVHANETCAPIMAGEVFRGLGDESGKVALFLVAYRFSLPALIDDPADAETTFSTPAGNRLLDVDLDGLDRELKRRYPKAIVYEFHNAEETQPMLGVVPGQPVDEFEVGWQNVDEQGRPGKYLIELPACYTSVDPALRDRRRRRVAELRAAGYEFNDRWRHYLECATDVEASRRKGYLADCLARKVADWIASRGPVES